MRSSSLFAGVIGLWLGVMLYGTYIWTLTMPFYRPLGVMMSLMVIGVAYPGWSALDTGNTRRGLVTLVRDRGRAEAGPLGLLRPRVELPLQSRPVGTRDRTVDAAKMDLVHLPRLAAGPGVLHQTAVRQLRSPHFLEYQPGPESKFVLLLPSEFENWPESAPPITVVAKFQDQSAEERILARTPASSPAFRARIPSRLELSVGKNRHPALPRRSDTP